MIKKTRYLTIVGLLLFLNSYSQTVISGEVKTDKGETPIGATVTVNNLNNASILAYGITNDKGVFNIKVNSSLESFSLNVSYLGFKKWTLNIENKSKNYEVTLETSDELLDEVLLDYKPIEHKRDTISYTVSAFTDKDDRVIADVIKKLPGIEVSNEGGIYYQGKPIQKYYIDGLDLLEGRYNLANNNLSAQAVSKVQILENHQPIKVLDSLVASDRASLNIKLQKDVTVSGSAKVGAGLSPVLWDVNITPMVFTKKRQVLVSYQANNTGRDLSRELISFYSEDLDDIDFKILRSHWINILNPSSPPFKKERWLDNNVHMGTTNFLWRLKKDLDLKVNLSYINDTQNMQGSRVTNYITPNDTINVVERNANVTFKKNLQSKFIIENNSYTNYFKNTLEVNGFWDSKRGFTTNNDDEIAQTLKNPFRVIKNDLQLYKTVGKQILTIKSNLGYTETDQNLIINPGQFVNLINGGVAYNQTEQVVGNSKFSTSNSVGFAKAFKKITLSPKVGFSFMKEHLMSNVLADDNNLSQNEFENDLVFQKMKYYLNTNIEFKDNTWNVSLGLPLSLKTFKLEDERVLNTRKNEFLILEPSLSIRKKLSSKWDMNIGYNRRNNFGKINSLYSGYILTNYRSINRYNAPLSENLSQNYNYGISYRNPLNGFFTNLSYRYSNSKNNLIFTSNIEDNGSIVFEVIERDNNIKSQNISMQVSKRIKKLNSTLSLNTSYSFANSEQLINNELLNNKSKNLSFKASMDSEITSWISTSLKSSISFMNTQLQDINYNEIVRQQHELNASFFFTDSQFLSVNSELYTNNISKENGTAFFMNLEYNYTLKKKKIDLFVTWNNIFNESEYVNVYNSDYASVETIFKMRPSQVFAGLKFSF